MLSIRIPVDAVGRRRRAYTMWRNTHPATTTAAKRTAGHTSSLQFSIRYFAICSIILRTPAPARKISGYDAEAGKD